MNGQAVHLLPRSLAPLADESLSGFLLRLGLRLSVPPIVLIRRTGLARIQDNGQAYTNTALSTAIPASIASEFATVTRLSPQEVAGLTLEPRAGCFPPIHRALQHPRASMDWLFTTTRRYCPRCLAGDGSQIQQDLGGPWNVLWRLPDVFACVRHRCFLEHLCPHCQQPIATRNYSQLISRGAIAGLHPAQCRAPAPGDEPRRHHGTISAEAVCGGRLDQPSAQESTAARPTTTLLSLQQDILTRLDPRQTTPETPRYFTDLHLVAALIMATWPTAAPVITKPLAQITDHVLTERRRTESAHTVTSNAPPLDARACAALLLAADTIVRSPDLTTAFALFTPSDQRTPKSKALYSWETALRKARPDCSPQLWTTSEKVFITYRKRSATGPRLPSGSTYRAGHVPALLPEHWTTSWSDDFPEIMPNPLRRAAAMRLVQRANGGSAATAAEFLGICVPTTMSRQLRRNGLTRRFEAALDSLEPLLAHGTHADYRHRRHALTDWTIPPNDWHELVGHLQHHRNAITDDSRRLACSTFVWSKVTQGEPRFAPLPPAVRGDLARISIWRRQCDGPCRYLQRPQLPYYKQLRSLLDEIIDRLIVELDTRAPTAPQTA